MKRLVSDAEIERAIGRANPYPGAPRFFRRVYDLGRNAITTIDPKTGKGERHPLYDPLTMLVIVGIGRRSDYPEDARAERQAWERRRAFMAENWSPMAPRGELGFVPLDEVDAIDRDEFVKLMKEITSD